MSEDKAFSVVEGDGIRFFNGAFCSCDKELIVNVGNVAAEEYAMVKVREALEEACKIIDFNFTKEMNYGSASKPGNEYANDAKKEIRALSAKLSSGEVKSSTEKGGV